MSEVLRRIGVSMPKPAAPRYYAAMVFRLSIVFIVVYYGCAWLAGRFDHGLRLYFDWERTIPLVPGMIYPYMSIALVFTLPLFTLDEPKLQRLELAFTYATLVAGVCFLALNAQIGFEQPAAAPENPFLRTLVAWDPPGNLIPSLHVTYAALVLRVVAVAIRQSSVRVVLGVWFAILSVSTFLVHQHHLIDMVSGAIVGWIAAEWTIRGAPVGMGVIGVRPAQRVDSR